jgi:eukaryotic-like serine/threonine-protein kinase
MATPTDVAGRYRIERRLGAGGMSTVYQAMDTVLERAVAVKLLAEHLAEDEAFVARFRREALAAARLMHPNVVQVFDSGKDEATDRHYIVMEYVDGPSCADLLREHKRLEVDETVAISRDACQALDYAHRAGVIHRDVKPGNLLISRETDATKLADFGIAKAAEQTRITQVGSVLGTAAYLSPEQARGEEAGPASDVYSLGVCAYQFLTGRLPHEYSSLTELALKQQEENIEPVATYRPEVPRELDAAIRVALARAPETRYASALDMARALEAGVQGVATEATRALTGVSDREATQVLGDLTAATQALRTRQAPAPSPPTPPPRRRERPQRKRQRSRWGAFLAFLLLLAAIVAVAIALLSANSPGPQPVDKGDVQQQIDGIRQFLDDHTQR